MISNFEKYVTDKISVCYAVFDQNFNVISASPEINHFSESNTPVLVGHDLRNYFPELFGIEKIVGDLLEGRKICFTLEGIYRKDENNGNCLYFNLQIIAQNYDPKNNEPKDNLVILFEDVTDRFKVKQQFVQKFHEANLALSAIIAAKSYVEQLIDSMADSLFVTDFTGTIKQVNPAAQRLFGYEKDELIGKLISVIIPEPKLLQQIQQNRQVCPPKNLLSNPEYEKNIEVNCRTKTGDETAVAFSCSMFCSEMTELQNYIYTGRDITDRQRIEAKLKQANEKLTQSVNQLQERNREINRLSELTHRLQGCLTLEEAYEAIAQMVPLIFPHSIGAIFTHSDDRQPLQIVAHWGDFLIANLETKLENFSISDCPAWQSGERYLTCDRQLCSLHQDSQENSSLQEYSCCIPMVVQGQSIGLFYVSSPELALIQKEKQQLAMTVAEHIGLALVNLKLRETLKYQSIRDPLTGLFNRRYLEESVEREIARASEQQTSIGLIILDVDHFKRFNDTFGHQAGDVVLQAMSKLLTGSIRNLDLACRYGGEEFIVILRDTDLEITQYRAEILRSAVKLLRLEHGGKSLGSISSSFGVACFPEHGQTLAELVAAADAALYRAKESGRDRVVTAS